MHYLKKAISKILRYLPIQSKTWGSPRYLISETKEWIENKNRSGKWQFKYFSIFPKQARSIHSARGYLSPADKRFELFDQTEIPETFVAKISKGRFYHFSTITECHGLLGDISKLPDHEIIWGPTQYHLMDIVRLPKNIKIEGLCVASAMMGASQNYCHWLLEELPRLELIKKANIDIAQVDKVIVSNFKKNYQKETLKALGVNEEKLLASSPYIQYESDLLIRPYIPCHYLIQPWILNFLKETFLIQNTNYCSQLIYISRKNESKRRIINEDKIVDLLSKYNFKFIDPEKMTVYEQAECFAAASVVIAPHGAALTNLVFCRPGTKVLEIFSPHYIDLAYHVIAEVGKLDYRYIFGEEIENNLCNHLISISVEKIKIYLNEMIKI